MLRKLSIIFFNLFCAFIIQAQNILLPDSAVSIALQNNFQIRIAHNESEIARINNSAGNAGMLPTFSINGSEKYSSEKNLVTSKTATVNNLYGSVALNWTIFDGGKMFITKSKLAEIASLGVIQLKEQVLQTIYDVNLAYYLIVKQKQQLASINQVIKYNKERVLILETGYKSGLVAKNSYLQSKIDLNVSLGNALNQENAIKESKRALNVLLMLPAENLFNVTDSIPVNYSPNREQLAQQLFTNNISVLAMQKEYDIAKLSVNEYNANRFPKLNFTSGFEASFIDNSAASSTKNYFTGPFVGASVSIPLYQAGSISRLIKVSKMQLLSAEFGLSEMKLRVNAQLQNALEYYEGQKQLYLLEKENAVLAKENLDISMERLKLGQTTALELRQAEQSFEDSQTRLLTYQYNLKTAETKLKQLMASF